MAELADVLAGSHERIVRQTGCGGTVAQGEQQRESVKPARMKVAKCHSHRVRRCGVEVRRSRLACLHWYSSAVRFGAVYFGAEVYRGPARRHHLADCLPP